MATIKLGSSSVAEALNRPDLAMNAWASDVAAPPIQGFRGSSVAGSFDLGNMANVQGRISLMLLGVIVVGMMSFTIWSSEFQK